MKASRFFALGTFFLGAAAVALSHLKGANAQQDAGEEFYCEHSDSDSSVDQVLSGHIAIFRPIVCETTQVRAGSALVGLCLFGTS